MCVCVCVVCVCVTVCHFTGFFLFSLRLLPKVFCILPVNVIRMVIDLVRVLSRIRACTSVHSFSSIFSCCTYNVRIYVYIIFCTEGSLSLTQFIHRYMCIYMCSDVRVCVHYILISNPLRLIHVV